MQFNILPASINGSQKLELTDIIKHLKKQIQYQFLITNNRRPITHTTRPENVQKLLVWRFKGEYVDYTLDEMVVVGFEEFCDHQLV